MEHTILAAIAADRQSFDRIDSYLDRDDLSPEGAIVLKHIRQFYYKDVKAPNVDMNIVRTQVLRQVRNPKHVEMFELYLDQLSDLDVSAVNVVSEVLESKRAVTESALAEAILAKDHGRVNVLLDKISDLRMDEELQGSVHEEYQGLEAEELEDVFDPDNLIRVAPKSLNSRLNGGVMRGHHIVIVAYPETGKTLMCLTMAKGFVHQGLKVLYVGNEDPIKGIIKRFVSCLCRATDQDIKADPQKYIAIARERGYDNVVFAGLAGGSLEDVKALVVKHEPDVLIVDQIRNLSAGAENRTQQLETVARGMRNMAREYDLVAVSVTQGADSARNKLVLDMGDVDGSNVGIPGTADVMVMIGMNDDYDRNNRRMIALAKNKIGGVHENWAVAIRREHSLFADYGI